MQRQLAIDRRISLHKLEVLCLVVELGGVGRAAEALFVAQPVVSAHIRSLEERLGTKLFYREGRRLHLTESGRVVHAWAEDVLARTRELDRHLAGLSEGSRGSVALGASMSLGSYRLPPVLTRFRRAHPEVELRLSIADTEHSIEDARAGALDFAIVVSDADPDGPGLETELLGHEELVLIAAPDAEPVAAEVAPAELAGLPFVEAPEGIVRRRFVDRSLKDLGAEERDVVLEFGHPEAMKQAVRAGLGVSMLFRSAVAEELELGLLREVGIAGADVRIGVYLVHRKGKEFSPPHRELLDEIRVAFGP
jgi:LysR family transcriptional regulator, low CO2-responsive transcriptional regulator